MSPGTRFPDGLQNVTKFPSPLIDGPSLFLLPSAPDESTLTRSVTPVARSWRKTSNLPFVSPETRLFAKLTKATQRPSPEMAALKHCWLAWFPDESTLASVVVPAARSRT